VVSAVTREGLDVFLETLGSRLPESPFHYDPDELATQPMRFFAAEFIREAAFDSVSRSQARMLILGRMTARQKVCSFLVEIADRSSGDATQAVVLPMSRYDIADYLAMSVETVSRTLTALRRGGAISLADRHRIRIVDRKVLEAAGGSY